MDAFFEKYVENRSTDDVDAIDADGLYNRAQFIKNIII